MPKLLERSKGCCHCSNINNLINDLTLLDNFLGNIIGKCKKEAAPGNQLAVCKVQDEITSAIGDIEQEDSDSSRPSTTCKCPEMKMKKELVRKLRKSIKQKLHNIYELNLDLKRKDKSKKEDQELTISDLEDEEDEEIPLPYHILRSQYQQEHYKALLEKKDILKKLLNRKLPRGLAYCDEDTLREEIGRHRLLPRGLYKNFVLERAFKGRESVEADLYGGFIATTKSKGPCGRVLTKKLLSPRNKKQTPYIHADSSLSENSIESSKDDDILYTFPNHIPDIKTANCECQFLSIKISRLEYVKELLQHVLESRDPNEQMLTMEMAHNLIKLITNDQVEENIKRRSTLQDESESNSEASETESRLLTKEERLHGSSSFERFRKKILHEMHVERRPLSWFKKRCNYFHKLNQKKSPAKVRNKNSEEGAEDERAQKIKNATDVAIKELLDLHKSKPYLTLQFPDDYTLKKLTMILEKLAEAEAQEEGTQSALAQAEESDWPFDKILKKKDELKYRTETINEKHTQDKTNSCLKKKQFDKCSCSQLQGKTWVHSKLIKEVQVLFLDAIFFMETLDKTDFELIDEIQGEQEIIEREKYFRGIDLDSFKVNFWEHIESGKSYESFKVNFESTWKNSVLNGLFEFNTEIQIMEKEQIILRPQKEKRVKIMSGGRVGLEPLYSEYVAKGMLDCVVLGDKYSGPSVRLIIQGMMEIATEEGILIIIMNELEYRLNFMIAMQQAQEIGIKTKLVLARDDTSCSKESRLDIGQNGSIGIVLQFKVAGAMAEEGYTLSTISRVCQFMFIASVSCNFDSDYVYIGTHYQQAIRKDEELSSGENDETKNMSTLDIVRKMLSTLMDDSFPHYISLEPGSEVILLLNNQSISYDQMFHVAQLISGCLNEIDVKLGRLYIGNFLALSQNGFTITIAKDLDKKLTPFLDKATTCNHWPPHTSGSAISKQAVLREIKDTKLGACIHPDYVPVVHEIFNECLKQMKIVKREMENRDLKHSSQIDKIISNIRPKYVFNKIPLDRPHQILLRIANDFEILDTYGIFLSIFFITAAQEFNINSNIFVKWRMLCNAFYKGACSLAGYLRYEKGDGSILDILLPLAKACFDTKQGWNPLRSFKYEFDKLEEAAWLRKEDPGIMLCKVLIKSIYDVLENSFGHLDWDAWEEKEDKMYVVPSTNKEKKRYGFSIEQIQPDIKEAIQSLTYFEGGGLDKEIVGS